MFWQQGLADAPHLVQRCVKSWAQYNPTWKLVVLDGSSSQELLRQHPALAQLGLAHQSDLLRLELLGRHGGVWADATCLCRCPLDQWIDDCCSSGFFAFDRPGRDRLIANWFLAAQPESTLLLRLHQRLLSYWQKLPLHPLSRRQHFAVAVLSCLLNRSHHTTRGWFSSIVSHWLGVYPYFVFHYAFERLVATDAESRAIWQKTPRVSAMPPRLIERYGFHTTASPALLDVIQQCSAPLFKLSWQYPCETGYEHTLLHHVLDHDS